MEEGGGQFVMRRHGMFLHAEQCVQMYIHGDLQATPVEGVRGDRKGQVLFREASGAGKVSNHE